MGKSGVTATPKKKDVHAVVSEYAHEFGTGVFWDLAATQAPNIPHMSTKFIGLNWLFGVGGVPQSRLIEIFGPESSGKTTLCYELIRTAQKDGLAGYIDTEHSADLRYAVACGVDRGKLIVAQPDYGEQAFSIVEKQLLDPRFSIVVLDSIAALSPRAETEGDMGDQYFALIARIISQSMRRISPILKRTKAVVVFVNQVRANISGYGSPLQTPGGWALKHAIQIKVQVKKREKIVSQGKQIGFMSELTTLKNKVATPYRSVKLPVLLGKGLDARYELISLGLQSKVIRKGGATYQVGRKVLGRNWKTAYEVINDNAKIRKFVVEHIEAFLQNQSTLDI